MAYNILRPNHGNMPWKRGRHGGVKKVEKEMSADMENWLKDLELGKYSPVTIQGYRIGLEKYWELFKEEPNIERIHEFMKGLVARPGVSDAVVYQRVRVLLAYAEDMGLVPRLDAKAFRKKFLKRYHPVFEPVSKALTFDQVGAIIEAATRTPRNLALVTLFYATALRLSSVWSLDVDDVNLDWEVIRVRARVLNGRRTLKHRQDGEVFYANISAVPGMPEPLPILKKYLEQRIAEIGNGDQAGAPLFVSLQGKRLSQRQIQRIFQDLGEEAGIDKKVTPHKFRHSLLTHLSRNVKAVILQRIADHKDLKMTGLYAAAQMVDVKEALREANGQGKGG